MIYFPPCKINLGLQILRKRADGYHDIETAMLEIPFSDVLEVVPASVFRLSVSGLEIPAGSNSCTDAFELMRERFGIPDVHIHLHKIVPMGGGLGGGSSDGAYTFKALNDLFGLGCMPEELESLAALTGSDTPFFIRGGLQLAQGRGEVLQPLDLCLPKLQLVLVNIGIHVPTATAYSRVVPQSGRPSLKSVLSDPIETWKTNLVNDFETSVFAQHPSLAAIKNDLYEAGAVYAAMSGSGSTMFGLFTERPERVSWSTPPVYEEWMSL